MDTSVLEAHPNVVKRWDLPYGHVLFEFYHPIFDKAWDSDFQAATWHHYNEPSKSQMKETYREIKRILGPLYVPGANPDRRMYSFYQPSAVYTFYGGERHSIKWPKLGLSEDWSDAHRIRIAGRLFDRFPETEEAFLSVIRQWHECVVGYGLKVQSNPMTWAGENFCSVWEFDDACGDATMALFRILTSTRNLTTLEAVGFFLPDDYASPFVDLRDLREKTPQVVP